jgi:hypothetical protein
MILTTESKQRLSVPLLGSRGSLGDVVIVKYLAYFNDLCGSRGVHLKVGYSRKSEIYDCRNYPVI